LPQISSLINISLSLPNLTDIRIIIPNREIDRDAICGSGNVIHKERIRETMDRVITGFKLEDGRYSTHGLPDISVDERQVYRYQPLSDGREGYKPCHVHLLFH
jgi:hypothetical protein